jgi:PhnB protein
MTKKVNPIPEGFHSLTPYLVCKGVSRLLDFLRDAFEAEETMRANRADGSVSHASVRLDDAMVEMGEPMGEREPMIAGLHYYVRDADRVFRRAIEAGAQPMYEPRDMDYGDHEGGIKDPLGNHWYIATNRSGKHFAPAGLLRVTPRVRVKGAAEFLVLVMKAFSANVVYKHEGPNGLVGHAKMRLGDSILECGEAHGEWGPRRMSLHLYVPDVDATYRDAILAGGKSLSEPKDQFYGERNGGVMDPWGNHWYIATHTEDLTPQELERRGAADSGTSK